MNSASLRKMNLGNGLPSFLSLGINGYDQEQLQVGAADTDVYNQPPSYGSLGYGQQENSHNQFQDGNLNRLLNHTAETVYNTKAPSFTGLGPVQVNSDNQDPNFNGELSGQQAPSVGAMARVGVSHPSGGMDADSGGQGLNLSDVNRREPSQNRFLASVVFDGPDAQEFVGMSLVGKNFRRFYPNAYYKEKDGEN